MRAKALESLARKRGTENGRKPFLCAYRVQDILDAPREFEFLGFSIQVKLQADVVKRLLTNAVEEVAWVDRLGQRAAFLVPRATKSTHERLRRFLDHLRTNVAGAESFASFPH